MAWINKILYKANQSAQAIVYNIGTTFNEVRSGEGNTYTLAALVDSLGHFFDKQSFMHYSKVEPPANSRYVEWYCLTGDDNSFGDTTYWDPKESLT